MKTTPVSSRSILSRSFTRLMLVAFFAAGVLASARFARAQPPATAPRTLGLDEILTLARQNNRDLKAARARLAQVAANAQTAWVALEPQAGVTGRYTHNYKEVALDLGKLLGGGAGMGMMAAAPQKPIVIQKGEQLDALANVSVPLIVPWAYFGVAAANATERAGEANLAVTETTVLLAAAQAYYQAAGTDEVLRARQSAVGLAERGVADAAARLEAGNATRVDVERAELQLVRARQATLEAEYARSQAFRALGTLAQINGQFTVEPPTVTATPVASDVDGALHLRPEFMALDATLGASEAQRRSSAWKWAPTASAFGQGRLSNYGGFAGDSYFWAVGAQLDWTLWDGGLRDVQRKVAWAQTRETAERIEQLRDSIRDDLANARLLVETKKQALTAAEKAVALARSTIELVQVQYENGATTQINLLQAQDSLVDADVGLAQARFDLAIADLGARRTAGTFPGKI